ncbi:MAG: aldo/keto reductase [Ktedonobacteraceae bacterium]|nr:aldo/keto reductase [Ktedonobacteraceae bacterium]
MRVSVLGLGSHEISCATSVKDVSWLLHSALDAGINLIDTAECYGRSEELIGRSVDHRRGDYYLFTKCGHGHAAGLDLPDWHPHLLMVSIERSLRRLRTDYLDVVQLHNCPRAILRRGEVIEVLQQARQAGKVRYLGYSGDREDALAAVLCGAFDTLQITVNVADQEAIDRILPSTRESGIGVIAKHPLANVAWIGGSAENDPTRQIYRRRLRKLNYSFLQQETQRAVAHALRFTLSIPGVDVVLVGTTKPQRIYQNLASVAEGPLSEEQFESIRSRWQTVTRWRKWIPGSRYGWRARI